MPRRNLSLLFLVGAVSLICYHKVEPNPYGRVWVDAMEQISERSLKEIGQRELFEGAMDGMVRRLEDPYSAYISPEKLDKFNETLDQQFGGVGMGVMSSGGTDQFTVTSPVIGTPAPAYEAGIRPGDVIRRIDGRSTQGLSLKDAVDYMRGEPDSPVRLAVLHKGQGSPVEIEIVRKVIQVDTVLGDWRRGDDLSWDFFLAGYDRIGYVRIEAFAKGTAEELQRAMRWLEQRGLRGLVLDLRGDPGGLLTAAEKVSDMFVDSGVIVTRRRRDGEIEKLATKPGTYLGFPMAVLVDQDSASASEIVAACLQDHARAVVVGQRTWGKGTVQEVITLADNRGALRLTTSGYLRPSRDNIHRQKDDDEHDVWGVMPDEGFQVIVDGEERQRREQWRLRRDLRKLVRGAAEGGGDGDWLSIDNDRQLAKAIGYIEAELAGRRPVLPGAAAEAD